MLHPLTDDLVAADLAQTLAEGGRVMIKASSRFRGGRSHLTLHCDADGYFVRIGRRGSCKQHLGRADILLRGEHPLVQYTLASHDAFEAEQRAKRGL